MACHLGGSEILTAASRRPPDDDLHRTVSDTRRVMRILQRPQQLLFLFFVGFFESSIRSSIRDVHATMSRACESLVGLTVASQRPAAGSRRLSCVHASAEKSHANATRCVECSRVRTRHRTYCSASYFIIETSNWIFRHPQPAPLTGSNKLAIGARTRLTKSKRTPNPSRSSNAR